MDILEIIFIGIGLSMDAFAVAVSGCMSGRKIKLFDALKVGLCFGIFQALMPFIGWLAAGSLFNTYIEKYDRWIALILLGYIGGKMLYDGIFKDDDEACVDITNNFTLFVLGIATSIDALMVGVTFVSNFKGFEIINPVSIIGITTFLISLCGVYLGKKSGNFLGNKSTIAGGIILILIGLK
ncbi:MAG: manganese efflux pump MntP family protein, partial [Clostridia bacterium]|nr:manganese efflux pump MntP family protein [Clostridia bacterium]